MTVSINNALVNGLVHNLVMQVFSPGSSKIEFFESCFYDIVITHINHPRYMKHFFYSFIHSVAAYTPAWRSPHVFEYSKK